MANPMYRLRIDLPAITLDLLSMTKCIPAGELIEVASECRKTGLVELLWNKCTYLTCKDTLRMSADRQGMLDHFRRQTS